MLNEKDILISACGTDENGFSKAIVKIENSILSISDKEPIVIDDIVMDNPIVNIFRSRAFTMIDMTFKNPEDFELKELSEKLKSFCSPENSLNDEFDEMPTICVTVCPKQLNGAYYILGLHAMWTLQPSSIGGNIDTVRFIIQNDYFNTYHFDIERLDRDQLEYDTQEEIANGII